VARDLISRRIGVAADSFAMAVTPEILKGHEPLRPELEAVILEVEHDVFRWMQHYYSRWISRAASADHIPAGAQEQPVPVVIFEIAHYLPANNASVRTGSHRDWKQCGWRRTRAMRSVSGNCPKANQRTTCMGGPGLRFGGVGWAWEDLNLRPLPYQVSSVGLVTWLVAA